MNPYALAFLVCAALIGLSLLLALGAHLVGAVLTAPQRALLVAVAFCAGFCTAIAAVAVSTP